VEEKREIITENQQDAAKVQGGAAKRREIPRTREEQGAAPSQGMPNAGEERGSARMQDMPSARENRAAPSPQGRLRSGEDRGNARMQGIPRIGEERVVARPQGIPGIRGVQGAPKGLETPGILKSQRTARTQEATDAQESSEAWGQEGDGYPASQDQDYDFAEREKLRRRAERIRARNARMLLAAAALFLIGFICGCLLVEVVHRTSKKEPVTSENVPPQRVAAAPKEETQAPIEIFAETGPVVVIDAGHGGSDPGCMEARVWECDINLQMALILQKKMEAKGIRVLMTRPDEEGISLGDRVDVANNANADAYISIHQNSFEGASVKGLELWYNAEKKSGGAESEELAEVMLSALQEEESIANRGLKPNDDLKVLRLTNMAAVLVEVGYLTNPTEQEKLLSEEYQDLVMGYIAEGVAEYLGIEVQ